MQSLILGGILVLGVLLASVEKASLAQYLHAYPIILVFGGAIGVFILSNPINVIWSVLRSLRSLGSSQFNLDKTRLELVKVVRKHGQNNTDIDAKDPLTRYALELWEQGVDNELFIVLLSQKKQEMESKTLDAVQALKNLSKYPPALGMIGTVIGMISLFSKLDQNKSNLGTSLSLAMTATFFGLVLTNTLLSPIADRMHVQHLSEKKYLESVYEILLLINRGEPPELIREEMRQRVS